MALSNVCLHLRSLTEKLSSLKAPHACRISYKTERVRQNLRLDLPSLQNSTSGFFVDGNGYPTRYPKTRGPNVSTRRDNLFQKRLTSIMPELNRLATSAASNDVSTVQAAIYSYFHQLEKMWGNEGNLTTIQRCNANNCANSVPDQLCRYINLRTFLKFALLPHASPARGLTATKINDLLESLEREKRKPGKSWHLVAQIWKEVRHEIESNKLDLRIKPRFARGDINFIGHGAPPLHKNPAIALRSPAMLKHIIRELALPGWESRADRLKNLGIVAVEVPSAGLRLFRPTILDNFGLFSYFFLPGLRSELSGLTWPLTGNLRFNSGRRYDGQQEWTVLVKPKGRSLGLSCVQTVAGKSSPTFQIAGLAFGDAYGQLFKE